MSEPNPDYVSAPYRATVMRLTKEGWVIEEITEPPTPSGETFLNREWHGEAKPEEPLKPKKAKFRKVY